MGHAEPQRALRLFFGDPDSSLPPTGLRRAKGTLARGMTRG